MKEEQKAKLEALTHRTAAWGKKIFTPRHVKIGAGVLVVLAVAGTGGKFALHRQKAAAHLEEAQARSNVLQNVAASRNITLLSTDAVKEKVAEALGTTTDAVNFRSVLLTDMKAGKPPKDKDKKFRDEHKKDHKEDRKDGRPDKRPDGPGHELADARHPGGPQGAPHMAFAPQPGMPGPAPEGAALPQPPVAAPDASAAQPKTADNTAAQPAAVPKAAPAARPGRFPAFYLADCEMGGMNYHFVIDAQNGQVIQTKVHKAGLLSQFLG